MIRKFAVVAVLFFAIAGIEFVANIDGLARHLLALVGVN